MERWVPGSTVILQEVWRDKLWTARPMTVVAVEPERLVLWSPKGTLWRTATDPHGLERLPTRGERFARRMTSMAWVMGEFTTDIDSLYLIPHVGMHAVSLGWLPDGSFAGWYINLQEQFSRGKERFRTMDLTLDLLISPDGTWRWKDEDELEVLVAAGVYPADLPDLLRLEGERVLEMHRTHQPPFSEGWERWRPEPWPAPVLPSDWETVDPNTR